MAHVLHLDRDTVLHRALELFWERGYESTSMADLVAHLGVARASIYATFGGKHDLYLKALQRYTEGPASYVRQAIDKPFAFPMVHTIAGVGYKLALPDARG